MGYRAARRQRLVRRQPGPGTVESVARWTISPGSPEGLIRTTRDGRDRYKLTLDGPDGEREELVIEWEPPLTGSKDQAGLVVRNYLGRLGFAERPTNRLRVDSEGCVFVCATGRSERSANG